MVIAPAMLGATMVAPTKPARARGRYFFKGPPEDVGGWPGSWECRSARAGRRGKAAFRLAVTLPSAARRPRPSPSRGIWPGALRYQTRVFAVARVELRYWRSAPRGGVGCFGW